MKNITGKKLCKILEQNGWELARISDSHHIYVKSGESAKIVVPFMEIKKLKQGF